MITIILFFAYHSDLVPWWLWCSAGIEIISYLVDKLKNADK